MNGAGNSLDIWPAAASASAVESDYLILAFTIVILFLTVPIFLAITYFAFKYRQGVRANREHSEERSVAIELSWMIIPFVLTLFFFFWGARIFIAHKTLPAGALAGRCHRPTMDVEVPASWRPIRNQRPSCAVGAECRAAHDLAGRDPRALHSGAAHPDGRAARPLYQYVVQGRQAWHLPPVLFGVLRDRSLGDGRAADHHVALRLRKLAQPVGVRHDVGVGRGGIVPLLRLFRLPPEPIDRPGAIAGGPLWQARAARSRRER